jgi:hypothetical protein
LQEKKADGQTLLRVDGEKLQATFVSRWRKVKDCGDMVRLKY